MTTNRPPTTAPRGRRSGSGAVRGRCASPCAARARRVPGERGDGGDVMLVSLAVIALGFLLLASFVIALGASSTERFEFERNRVQPQRQRSTVASGGGLAGWAAETTRAVSSGDAEVRI